MQDANDYIVDIGPLADLVHKVEWYKVPAAILGSLNLISQKAGIAWCLNLLPSFGIVQLSVPAD